MKLRYLLFSLIVPMVLTGCGLVATFIPPIEVGDPLGLEGQTLTTTFSNVSSAALSSSAISTAQESIENSFDDVELDLRGFSLKELDAGISFDASVTLVAPDTSANFPSHFTLTDIRAVATVSDAANGEAVMSVQRSTNLRFDLDAASCSGLSCQYNFTGNEEDLVGALRIQVPASERGTLRSFVNIIRLDGSNSVNTGTFNVSVQADSNPSLNGFKATFKLHSEGTKVKLGG